MKSFDFRERLEYVDWQKILENLPRLVRSFNRMVLVVLGRYTKGWSITAFVLAKAVYRLYKSNGPAYCSAYLKVCNTALLNYLGTDLKLIRHSPIMYKPRCSLTREGLPRIILTKHRKIIRKGGPEAEKVVRLYLTLFGFYRTYINKTSRPDLTQIWTGGGIEEITGEELFSTTPNLVPGEHDAEDDLKDWLQYYFPEFIMTQFRNFPSEITLGFSWKPTWSGGPNTRKTPFQTTVNVLRHDLNHWRWDLTRRLSPALEKKRASFYHLISTQLYPFRTIQLPLEDKSPCEGASFLGLVSELGTPIEGRWGTLGKKLEGGGKVRVFAMLDSIRQALLRPIHNWLMSALRIIPNDGTYNQLGPLYRLRDKKIKRMFSFDLTAATDRFPIFLQSRVLQGFFGPRITLIWEYLMELPFDVPFVKKKLQVFFEIGQPLGAYSSWAAFSLTHHAFVQYCAQKAGLSNSVWFRDYAILGDDVIIAHERTARIYKELMLVQGVRISAHKTIVSNNGSCEFAKRFLWKGTDISPISFKEVYATRRSTCSSLVTRLQTFRQVLRKEPYRWFGAGHRVLPSHMRPLKGRWKRFHLMLTSPSGPFPLPFYWWCSQYTKIPLGPEVSAQVHCQLMDKWQFSFEPEGIPSELESDIVEEVLMGRPWITSWLSTSTPFLLALMGEDPITAWFHRPTVPSTAERPRVERSLRMGKVYWIYDRMVIVSRRPPLKRLGS